MYYAFDHTYGATTVGEDDKGNVYFIGNVHVFDTRDDRDGWVYDDPRIDGNTHREAISAKTARRYIRSAVWDIYFDPFNNNPIEELLDAYAGEYPECMHI